MRDPAKEMLLNAIKYVCEKDHIQFDTSKSLNFIEEDTQNQVDPYKTSCLLVIKEGDLLKTSHFISVDRIQKLESLYLENPDIFSENGEKVFVGYIFCIYLLDKNTLKTFYAPFDGSSFLS